MDAEHQSKLVQELYDRERIRSCLARYARGNDRTDPDLIRSVYHDNSWDDHGPVKMNGPDFAYRPSRRARSRLATHHMLGQMMIDLEGDTAYAETYFISHNMNARPFYDTLTETPDEWDTRDEEPSTEVRYVTMLLGRYLDRLDKIDSEWRITSRKVLIDWGYERPGPFDPSVLAKFNRSQRYPDDLIYRMHELRVPESAPAEK